MSTESSRSPDTSGVVWACVEDGFYVATLAAKFLGFVDRFEHDAFQVCNARSEQVGLFDSLDAAKACLMEHARRDGLLQLSGEEQG